MSRESLDGFNTNRVAAVAGVSVGTLYQYFPNKAALVTALIERAQDDLVTEFETLVRALDGQSLDASLHAVVALAIRQQYGNPLLAAALDHEERRLPLQGRLQAGETRMLACIEQLLRRHRRRLAVSSNSAAARDCLVLAKALVEADAAAARRPPPDLAARIVRALMGYLTWNEP